MRRLIAPFCLPLYGESIMPSTVKLVMMFCKCLPWQSHFRSSKIDVSITSFKIVPSNFRLWSQGRHLQSQNGFHGTKSVGTSVRLILASDKLDGSFSWI